MLIESVDGFYYQNPRFYGPRWIVFCEDDLLVCQYVGTVGCNTIQRAISKKGIKAVADFIERKTIIISNRLIGGSQVDLLLKKPIPVPTEYSAKLSDYAGAEECVIQFSGDCRMTI